MDLERILKRGYKLNILIKTISLTSPIHMIDYLEEILKKDQSLGLGNILRQGKIGFEKESLRIRGKSISKEPHPIELGSALCNKYITNDFSEAQPELITPPYQDSNHSLNFLNDIHHFLISKLSETSLWPFSMPPILSEDDVQIANFGKSNLGLFKNVYRKGLSHRYGKLMQTISGVHVNYSLPLGIWDEHFFFNNAKNTKSLRSEIYFRMLRNAERLNWMILYLFGCSPFISKNFILQNSDDFIQVKDEIFYLPYATSLRMSEYGYQNLSRVNLSISSDSIENYISDLNLATKTVNPNYLIDSDDHDCNKAQISPNLLQMEDEYYAVARVKSENQSDERFITKLRKGGVDFLELRSFDLNPFNKIGVDRQAAMFAEMLLIYCSFSKSHPISVSEKEDIFINDIRVAKYGRKPGLKLRKNGEEIELREWGDMILQKMTPIAELLDSSEMMEYSECLTDMRLKLQDPTQTVSAKLVEEVFNNNNDFIQLGLEISSSNKAFYSELDKSKNKNWNILNEEVKASLQRQKKLEKENINFEEFKKRYFDI